MKAFIHSLSEILYKISSVMTSIILVALCLIIDYSVIMRFIFNNPVQWQYELTLVGLCWATFIGMPMAFHMQEHMKLTFVTDRLKPNAWRVYMGVIDALRKMDAAGARAIMMIATCVTDLIGEDFDSIIAEIQPELNAKLSYVTMGQFKNFGSPIGTWKTAEAIGAYMEPRETVPGSVNILFMEPWHTRGQAIEYPLIVGALEKRGVPLRSFAAGATLDDFLDAPSAALNLVTTSYTQPLAEQMRKRFGVPYVPLHNAFSVAQVDEAYAMIERELGVDLSEEFRGWRDKAVELEERARRELKGLTFACMTGVDMPVAFARYLSEFGMEPLLLDVQDFHREDAGYAKTIKERGFDPPVCHIMYRDRDVLIIRDLHPDICFGYISEPVEGLKVAEEMGDFFGITGYERVVGILSRIFTVLETGKKGERLDIYGPVPV